jgi:phage/plasmid-like protein (TIGR03299 family)
MAANVESMFYVREVPWHGMGINVDEALSSEEALKVAGLDWTVSKRNIFITEQHEGIPTIGLPNYLQVPEMYANVRSIDNLVLGFVTNKYKIVQNKEAFAFTDTLLGEGVKFETAGSLNYGEQVWLLAKLPEIYKAAGDDVSGYLCFSNGHNGKVAVRIILTPVRVVCQNTLNLAIRGAQRIWSAHHSLNINERIEEARHTLQLADSYYRKLEEEADRLANQKVDYELLIDKLFPASEELSKVKQRNNDTMKNDLRKMLMADDIQKFDNTAWGFVNAVSDLVTHGQPLRVHQNWKDRRLAKAFDGFPLLDTAYDLVRKAA